MDARRIPDPMQSTDLSVPGYMNNLFDAFPCNPFLQLMLNTFKIVVHLEITAQPGYFTENFEMSNLLDRLNIIPCEELIINWCGIGIDDTNGMNATFTDCIGSQEGMV